MAYLRTLCRAQRQNRAMTRQQKITLGEMRESGPTRLIVLRPLKCAHSVVISSERWPDHVRLSDLEPKFICQVCGHRGADIRPLFETAVYGNGRSLGALDAGAGCVPLGATGMTASAPMPDGWGRSFSQAKSPAFVRANRKHSDVMKRELLRSDGHQRRFVLYLAIEIQSDPSSSTPAEYSAGAWSW
jgi:hypothetical protein